MGMKTIRRRVLVLRARPPTSRERLEVSGIMAYFVERTPLVRVQNFHVELTSTNL